MGGGYFVYKAMTLISEVYLGLNREEEAARWLEMLEEAQGEASCAATAWRLPGHGARRAFEVAFECFGAKLARLFRLSSVGRAADC
tara:strand:- start:306 stop:563 length:258 start_codon:yes stop_codon:yes gene_type:complete